jgi:hypothetical protein
MDHAAILAYIALAFQAAVTTKAAADSVFNVTDLGRIVAPVPVGTDTSPYTPVP